MSGLPKILDFSGAKPRGVSTEHKQMRFTPLTSFNSYITNDIVRFWLPMVKGFWDPYKSYIELEVEVAQEDFPYGTAIQVDNSASSFISQMTVFVDSQQVQRVQEYDTISALLHDMMYTPADKFGKQYEGLGYAQHDSMGHSRDTRRQAIMYRGGGGFNTPIATWGSGATVSNSASDAGVDRMNIYCSGYVPQRPVYITPKKLIYPVINALSIVTGGNTNIASANVGDVYGRRLWSAIPGAISVQGSCVIPGGAYAAPTSIATTSCIGWHGQPAAYQFLSLVTPLDTVPFDLQGNTLADGSTPNRWAQFQLGSSRSWIQSHRQSTMYGIQSPDSYNFTPWDANAYLGKPATHTPTLVGGTNQTVFNPSSIGRFSYDTNVQYSTSTVQTNGYTQAFSEHLSNGSFQPMFAPQHPQTWIHNGAFLEKPVGTRTKIFQIPIISSLFGVLIPAESYKLLPMEAFKNLMLEFRLNEYAMFTSGYKQVPGTTNATNVDKMPMTTFGQLQRKWKINRFQIWGQIYQFDDFITNAVQSMLSSGITLSSSAWNIGPRFSLASTASIKNTWQINCGHQSLKTLAFRIQSDDYQQYSFCRQHYYYSGNITSLQLKIANTYIPPQPILGHGGNVIFTGSQRSNTTFLIQLHKAFNKLFNIGPTTYINPINFAVNDRPYDPTDTRAYRLTLPNQPCPVLNNNTARGLALFHQNRCVGRAVYAFNLEAIPGEPDFISGLDTTKYRPFQVLIDSESTNHNNRDSTLVFLLNFDTVYVLGNGVPPQVYGKGSSV